MNNNKSQNFISVATLLAPKLDLFSLMINGTVLQVLDPDLIRLFSQVFRIPYKVVIPTEGNWNGMLGMVERGEIDLAVGSIAVTEDRFNTFNFSYPYYFSEVTFMTDKLKPLSNSSILLYPFSITSWIFLVIFILSVSFILFSVTKQTYNDALFKVFESIMGHAIYNKSRNSNLRMILGSWLIFIFVITNSYRAIFLSFLSFTPLTGIRNTADLTRATEENLIACYTYKGGIYSQVLLKSDFDSWKSVGNCIQRTTSPIDLKNVRDAKEAFFKASPKKAFIGSKQDLKHYERHYFVSKDYFFKVMYAFPTSRNFCCLEYLNNITHRLFAAGFFQKLKDDEKVLREIKREILDTKDLGIPKKLGISDFKVAFVVLIFGHILASVVFFIEITVNYLFADKNTIIHQREKNLQGSTRATNSQVIKCATNV